MAFNNKRKFGNNQQQPQQQVWSARGCPSLTHQAYDSRASEFIPNNDGYVQGGNEMDEGEGQASPVKNKVFLRPIFHD